MCSHVYSFLDKKFVLLFISICCHYPGLGFWENLGFSRVLSDEQRTCIVISLLPSFSNRNLTVLFHRNVFFFFWIRILNLLDNEEKCSGFSGTKCESPVAITIGHYCNNVGRPSHDWYMGFLFTKNDHPLFGCYLLLCVFL